MERTSRNPLSALLAVLATLVTGGLFLVVRRWRRRVAAGAGGRGPDDGGGLAGVREPRRPLPRDLVDAGAANPAE